MTHEVIFIACGALIMGGILLASYRLFCGPSRFDRVLAMDLILIGFVGIGGILALIYNRIFFTDLSMMIAIAGFLSTLAFCHYMRSEI